MAMEAETVLRSFWTNKNLDDHPTWQATIYFSRPYWQLRIGESWCNDIWTGSKNLPETNIFAPKNGWFPSSESPNFQGAPYFQGLCLLVSGRVWFTHDSQDFTTKGVLYHHSNPETNCFVRIVQFVQGFTISSLERRILGIYIISMCIYIYIYILIFVYMLIALLEIWEDDGDISHWIGFCFKTPWQQIPISWSLEKNIGTQELVGSVKQYWTNSHQTFQVPKMEVLTYISCMYTAYGYGSFPSPPKNSLKNFRCCGLNPLHFRNPWNSWNERNRGIEIGVTSPFRLSESLGVLGNQPVIQVLRWDQPDGESLSQKSRFYVVNPSKLKTFGCFQK